MNLTDWLHTNALAVSGQLAQKGRAGLNGYTIMSYTTRAQVIGILKDLRSLVLPGVYTHQPVRGDALDALVSQELTVTAGRLSELVKSVLLRECAGERDRLDCVEKAEQITIGMLEALPEIRRMLDTDIRAAYEGDPAAQSLEEIILSYPSLEAISIYRIAHCIGQLGVPVVPRIMTEYAHKNTGIDIHPGAQIGESFFIDHGTGVVIGETCVIGNHVKLYQGVTLGAKSFPLDEHGNPIKGIKRHPDIEDDVVIYSGATILGNVVIGRGSVIGGNVWLTQSVPPGSTVFNAQPSPVIKQK